MTESAASKFEEIVNIIADRLSDLELRLGLVEAFLDFQLSDLKKRYAEHKKGEIKP